MQQQEAILQHHNATNSPFRVSGGMYAVVDCNSFYCSCERVFRPELIHKPVVVLSNNDGCIVSRSDEVKALGVDMAVPYFKAKDVIEENDVATFSSNYNLYGDLSWRVMETLRMIIGAQNVEVYSVDEAFLNMNAVPFEKLDFAALQIRQTVEQWTGVAVSVGVAPTKTLSKVANHIAKLNKKASSCVTVLKTQDDINHALLNTPVKDVWGVGTQYADKLRAFGIFDAYHLIQMPEEWARKNLGGVVGLRLIKELKGEPFIVMDEELVQKKMIATTRMFGAPVKDKQSVKEAVATYTSRAAEKLRRQFSAASVISAFIVPKIPRSNDGHFSHGPIVSDCIMLPHATCVTSELIKAAMQIVDRIYEEGKLYKKAGVMLSGIIQDTSVQGDFFVPREENNNRMLMSMMDNINFSMRDDILKFAASGTKRNWKMRQEFRSPRYTSRWDELCEVR
jgi:DNA polymerase V